MIEIHIQVYLQLIIKRSTFGRIPQERGLHIILQALTRVKWMLPPASDMTAEPIQEQKQLDLMENRPQKQ